MTSPSKSGVAYLTENLVRRLTKEENISQITILHVTLGKDLNKKIKVCSKNGRVNILIVAKKASKGDLFGSSLKILDFWLRYFEYL